MIRDVKLSDSERITEIYNYYIENTIITFEEIIVSNEEIKSRIKKIQKQNYPYIIYEENNKLLGYAYVDKWRQRSAFDITLETSIYIDKDYLNKGIGKVLYKELIDRTKKLNIHSLVGVISIPNKPSRKLHQELGFQLIGNFREVGIKFNQLIDVEFWQLNLSKYEQF